MSEENKHVFDASVPLELNLNWKDENLGVLKVNVPVKVDTTGAGPNMKFPSANESCVVGVRGDFSLHQLDAALSAGAEAFVKAFNESMEARNA